MEFQIISVPFTPPPRPRPNTRGATKIQREGGKGGSESFLGGLRVRLMSKQTVILLLIGVPKQKLMFSSMIFYWRSAECSFHGLQDSLCNPIVVGL